MTQLYFGLVAEGTTDYRFLKPIVEKTIINVAFECKGQIDIYVYDISKKNKGDSFIEAVMSASQKGTAEFGISALIVHSDADAKEAKETYKSKINPATQKLAQTDNSFCKHLIALVPIQETEAWLLADKVLFKKVINTRKNDVELNIDGNPESFASPKERVEEAIRIGRENLPKKQRNQFGIEDLYSLVGDSMDIENLKQLKSYQDFERNVRNTFIELNLILR